MIDRLHTIVEKYIAEHPGLVRPIDFEKVSRLPIRMQNPDLPKQRT